MGVFLGFDFGTSAIKATAVDSEGRVLAKARVPCSTVSPRPGWFEVETEDVWRKGFLSALAMLGKGNVEGAQGLCVSSLCATFVPVDASLKPVYNAILYGIDTRASGQVDRINATCPPSELMAVTGGSFTSHSVFPKVLWLKEEMPEVYAASKHFLESSNYITAQLCGEIAWDLPSAAGGHMIDLSTLEYPMGLLERLGLDSGEFPRLLNPLDPIGSITKAAARETGIPEGTVALTGACDINAEAFACGAVYPGDLTVVYGSTVSTLFILDSQKSLPGFLTGPSLLSDTFRIGGATSSGGRYLDWVRKTLELSEADTSGPSATPSKIVMLPYLDGARTPVQDPHARLLWYGMSSSSNRRDLWTAAKESMGYELAAILEKMEEASPVPERIHVMGGLTADTDFMQIVSNITGKALVRFPSIDASYGDALMALSQNIGLDSVRRIVETANSDTEADGGRIVRPDEDIHNSYKPYAELYKELSADVHGLAQP